MVIGIIVHLLIACTSPRAGSDEQQWVDKPNEHARFFRVATSGELRRLIVLGTGGEGDTLAVLYLNPGTREAAFDGIPWVRIPFERLAVLSTTHLAYVHALGRVHTVVGATHLDQVMDTTMLHDLSSEVQEIGSATGLDQELLIALSPDVLFKYPFGEEGRIAHNLAGTTQVPVTEYLEEHPLGRAEWIRFFGVLLGEEALADGLYRGICDRYNNVVQDTKGLERRPTVFFGSAWQGRWFVPPGNSYMATLIHDAGGAYVYESTIGASNRSLDLEIVLGAAGQADHFGAVLAVPEPVDALALAHGDARVATLSALRNGGFAANSASSDLFGKALLEPDLILRDLRCIFHPSQCTGHRSVHFRSIAQ